VTITSEPTTAARPHITRPTRDASIDVVRALLLIIVVGLHAMMVGVSVGAAGPELANALENQPLFTPVSWLVQIMPLFFIVGGFASITQWRSLRARGASPADYVRGRVDRLVRPAVALVAVVASALLAMTILGVDPGIVATASFRIGQPLWFLAVYILCSALVPVMARAHDQAVVATPLLLLVAVVAVDLARISSGLDAVGFFNLLFVWLLVQQLGFWLADGRIDSLGRRTRGGILTGALAVLLVVTSGPYSPDMLVNLNPPTVCLVVLGVAQLMVFSVLRSRIAALAARPRVARVVGALGQRSMTVYLWHMPVLIALSAGLLVANAVGGVALPEPLSWGWWATRPAWLVCVGFAVAPVVLFFARFERGGRPNSAVSLSSIAFGSPSPRFIALDTILGAAGVATALVLGFAPVPAALALGLLLCALTGTARLQRIAKSSRWMTIAPPSGDAVSRRTF
jgi:fucose 4-O-acetylase-like acetyltransferase